MNVSKKYLFFALTLPLQIVIVNFLSTKPRFIETYYATGIYPYIASLLRILLGWLPFSFGDLLGITLIIIFLKKAYKHIKNKFKNTINIFLKLISFASLLYFCFYFFWGLNYFREPLSKNIKLTHGSYTTAELETTTNWVVEKLNTIHLSITNNDSIIIKVPYSRKEIYSKASEAYKLLANKYPQFNYQFPSVKNSLVSTLQSYNGTSGYLNPITNEAQVNAKIPKQGYAATACHEIAHQLGWSAENEANFIAFLATSFSNDVYFNYSGYRMVFAYCIGELRKRNPEKYKEVLAKVNKGILKDFSLNNSFWKTYKNPIEPYIKKGYNSYLKANNQKNGIASYSYVVDLLIAYRNQQL